MTGIPQSDGYTGTVRTAELSECWFSQCFSFFREAILRAPVTYESFCETVPLLLLKTRRFPDSGQTLCVFFRSSRQERENNGLGAR